MKVKEIRELSDEELKSREEELRERIFRARFRKSLGEIDAVKDIRRHKKELARVLTIRRERMKG
ncbi:MAG: 50S ribosomal protein L29 [Acidobacteriota bacterium]|nr:50S ribosomal protein L29 [Blastocatellia bacterium]MDW8412633.1 50S ribosomal protein L29 [Acidobacteriota bacterium]